jgi:Sap, sulfolipid-1-addressing protein
VISATGHVIFYALVAAASPLVLTATFVVIRSERQRTNSIAFLIGFLLGTSIAAVLGLLIGQAAVKRLGSHGTLEGLLALLVGLALVAAGLQRRHGPSGPGAATDREDAILARLSHVRPAVALPMAALLGFGGPKRLVLTFLAMASISGAELGPVETLTLFAVYIAIATLLVSVPVGIVVVGGSRAATAISRSESWLETNAALLRVWLALGFGAALVVDGLLRLI